MQYEFSVSWFFIGILLTIAGVAFMRWHRWVADNFGSGLGSYDKYKMYALITVGLGLLVTVNLHTTILVWFFRMIFPAI